MMQCKIARTAPGFKMPENGARQRETNSAAQRQFGGSEVRIIFAAGPSYGFLNQSRTG